MKPLESLNKKKQMYNAIYRAKQQFKTTGLNIYDCRIKAGERTIYCKWNNIEEMKKHPAIKFLLKICNFQIQAEL